MVDKINVFVSNSTIPIKIDNTNCNKNTLIEGDNIHDKTIKQTQYLKNNSINNDIKVINGEEIESSNIFFLLA